MGKITHGQHRSITYSVWRGMVQRTTNPGHKSFPMYAGKVAPEFLGPGGFARFLESVGERPSTDYSLDRIDPRGAYEPGNLRWADRSTQERNKIRRTFYGRTVEGWADVLGVRPTTIRKRIERKWPHEKAFPVGLRLA